MLRCYLLVIRKAGDCAVVILDRAVLARAQETVGPIPTAKPLDLLAGHEALTAVLSALGSFRAFSTTTSVVVLPLKALAGYFVVESMMFPRNDRVRPPMTTV